jgi:hypothetical protein
MTTKGYLILAQNNSTDDYVSMAYALALSIKLSQTDITSVSLITDVPDAVPHHYKDLFDHIIQIPWFDDAYNSDWKIENRWKIYHVSPYDQTVLLDADMIFLTDIGHWWRYLENNHDLFITDTVFTYRNEIVTDTYYRKAFEDNNLPNTYSAFTYFKKSELAEEFWKTVEIIAKNWQVFYNKFLPNSKPKHLSMDVVFSLAIKILGIEDLIISRFNYPTFVHMKSKVQNWQSSSDNWMNHVSTHFNKPNILKIGNIQQSGIFHYTEKKFLDHILKVLERSFEEKNNGSI